MFSVVICTFNGEAYMRAQLESILSQSRKPDAIILSDDGSTDATLSIAREVLAGPNARGIDVTILHRDSPLGPAGNFSDALGRLTHGYVALADQDDLWRVDKLAVLEARLDAEPGVLAVHTDAALVDGGGRRLGALMATLRLTRSERAALLEGRGLEALLRRNLATGATMALRHELLERALPIPPGWVHDEWLALVAALSGGLRFEDQELIDYRQHESNDIGARALTTAEASRRLAQPRGEFFAQKEARNDALRALVASAPSWLSQAGTAALRGKLEHDKWRSRLPRIRAARIPAVVSRLLTGHYRLFARGIIDVVRDLVLRG